MPSPQRPWPRLVQALVQSLLMGLFVLASFFVFWGLQNELAVASLGASSFIAFYFPNADASRPRYLLGGYACGLGSGLLCHFLLFSLLPSHYTENLPLVILFCALSVFLTGFGMSVFSFPHPPSAALAISVVIHPNPFYAAMLVYGMVLLLAGLRSLLHRSLGRYFSSPLPKPTKESPPEN